MNDSWSGRRDLNPGPLAPQASALARLRHGPKLSVYRNALLACFTLLSTVGHNRDFHVVRETDNVVDKAFAP